MSKTWLVEGFCSVDEYHCLMPVAYEPVGDGDIIENYKKSKMVCRHTLAGECDKGNSCEFFEQAPETLDKNVAWYEG